MPRRQPKRKRSDKVSAVLDVYLSAHNVIFAHLGVVKAIEFWKKVVEQAAEFHTYDVRRGWKDEHFAEGTNKHTHAARARFAPITQEEAMRRTLAKIHEKYSVNTQKLSATRVVAQHRAVCEGC